MEKRELSKEEQQKRAERRRHRGRFRTELKTLTAMCRAMRPAIRAAQWAPGEGPGRLGYVYNADGSYKDYDYERPENVYKLDAKLRLMGAKGAWGQDARHLLLAYAFWRGKNYRLLEPRTQVGAIHQPDPKRVVKALRSVDWYWGYEKGKSYDETEAACVEVIKKWLAEPEVAKVPAPKREKRPYTGPKGRHDPKPDSGADGRDVGRAQEDVAAAEGGLHREPAGGRAAGSEAAALPNAGKGEVPPDATWPRDRAVVSEEGHR